MGLANITPTQHHTTPTSTALNLRRGASALPVSSSPAPVARPTSAPVLGTGTPEEEAVARQKAAFVAAVMQLTRVEGLAARDAARLEGTRTDRYPALVSAGKGGRSLLAAFSAYVNSCSWLT